MAPATPLRIGITCYPSVGGSGILATALGEDLADRGHEVHFICYERPFRLPADGPRLHFHPVVVNDYGLFKYPDYTLPLSVRMAEVSRDHRLDVLHVHYAVPHATAAILARSMLPPEQQPRVVTTLHGTDTTLLGHDPGYAPAIRHALTCSDAVTAVSAVSEAGDPARVRLRRPDRGHPQFLRPAPAPPLARGGAPRARPAGREVVVVPLLQSPPGEAHRSPAGDRRAASARATPSSCSSSRGSRSRRSPSTCGGSASPTGVIVREKVSDIEDYLQVADIGLFTSDTESFCLSILEAMCFGCPSVSTRVGGIPEVVEDNVSGVLVPAGDADALASALEGLIHDPARRSALGRAAQARARELFSAEVIVPRYEALYRRLCR